MESLPDRARNDKPRGKGPGYVMVRHEVIARADLSDAALRAWIALDQWAHKGEFPSNAELARACGWPNALKAKRALRELEQLAVIKRHTTLIGSYFKRSGLDVTYPGPTDGGGSNLTQVDGCIGGSSLTQGGSNLTQGVGHKRPRGWVKDDLGGGSNLTLSSKTREEKDQKDRPASDECPESTPPPAEGGRNPDPPPGSADPPPGWGLPDRFHAAFKQAQAADRELCRAERSAAPEAILGPLRKVLVERIDDVMGFEGAERFLPPEKWIKMEARRRSLFQS